MKIDTIRMENIRLAVSMIGRDENASVKYEANMLRDWAEQMILLANEID